MAYTTQADVEAKVSALVLDDVLDDNGDGQRDSGLLDQVIANASIEVDGFICNRVTTPVVTPPASVQSAALWFTIRDLYGRRQRDLPKDWAAAIAAVEKWLMAVRDGTQTLDFSSVGALTAAAGTDPRVPGRVPSGSQTTY